MLDNESDVNGNLKALGKKIETKILTTKAELKVEQHKIVKLQTYDLSLFYW